MREKIVQPSPRHAAFRTELLALLDKHAGKLDASEMLALASHAVGQLIAFQDQRKMTPDLAMAVVSRNIVQGNREAMNAVSVTKGSA